MSEPITKSGAAPYIDRYEQGFTDLLGVPSGNGGDAAGDRQLIAGVLLDAVLQSFRPHEHKARRWLSGIYAQSLLILLDISPTAALEHLEKKWRRIDTEALTPPPGAHVH